MLQIIGLIVVVLFEGIVAKLLMPGRDPGGFIITILLGIAGSFVGAFVGSYLHIGAGWFTSFALAVIGAMLLLALRCEEMLRILLLAPLLLAVGAVLGELNSRIDLRTRKRHF